jgi:hypothetical protein
MSQQLSVDFEWNSYLIILLTVGGGGGGGRRIKERMKDTTQHAIKQ